MSSEGEGAGGRHGGAEKDALDAVPYAPVRSQHSNPNLVPRLRLRIPKSLNLGA